MNIPKKQKPVRKSFYFFEEIEDMLKTICETYDLNCSQVIRILVEQEYENIFLIEEKLETKFEELTKRHKDLGGYDNEI